MNGFNFAIDVGGKYFIHEYLKNITGLAKHGIWQQEHDIMVTQPNVFTVSRLAEEERSVFKYDAGQARLVWLVKVKLDYIAEGTDEFRAMAPDKRGCLYPDEMTLHHFDTYSESNCKLQCSWERAAQQCGCVPWFLMDMFASDEADMCEAVGNRCFRDVVKARYDDDGDSSSSSCASACLPDCETVHYEVERAEKALAGTEGL